MHWQHSHEPQQKLEARDRISFTGSSSLQDPTKPGSGAGFISNLKLQVTYDWGEGTVANRKLLRREREGAYVVRPC